MLLVVSAIMISIETNKDSNTHNHDSHGAEDDDDEGHNDYCPVLVIAKLKT